MSETNGRRLLPWNFDPDVPNPIMRMLISLGTMGLLYLMMFHSIPASSRELIAGIIMLGAREMFGFYYSSRQGKKVDE